MQPRLQPRARNSNSFIKSIIKLALVILIGACAFFYIEKIDFPSPQKEINENVTDKIIKIK